MRVNEVIEKARYIAGSDLYWQRRVRLLQDLFAITVEECHNELALDYITNLFEEDDFIFIEDIEEFDGVAALFKMGYSLQEIHDPAVNQVVGLEPHQVMARWGAKHGWSIRDVRLLDVFSARGEDGLKALKSGTAEELSEVLDASWRVAPGGGPFKGITEVMPWCQDLHEGDIWNLWHVTCTGNTAIWQCTRNNRQVWRVLSSGYADPEIATYGCFKDLRWGYKTQKDQHTLAKYLVTMDDPRWDEGLDLEIEIEGGRVVAASCRGIQTGVPLIGGFHVLPLIDPRDEGFESVHLGHLRPQIDEAEVSYWENRLGV